MHISDTYKAAFLSGIISAVVLVLLFSFHITQHTENLAESYYIIEPKTEAELKAETLEKLKAEQAKQVETNKAYNETDKKFAQAYQPIAPPKDYEFTKTPSSSTTETTSNNSATAGNYEISDAVITAYNHVNSVLKQQQSTPSAQAVNKKSSMHYSLVNRTHTYLPTPIYLCDSSGKVVVNITVNNTGAVIKSYINNAATTGNNCLQEHALEYANASRFNVDNSKKTQLGAITFYFEGKN